MRDAPTRGRADERSPTTDLEGWYARAYATGGLKRLASWRTTERDD